MAKKLRKGDETQRRWKIISVSRNADASSLPQLLARLESETPSNKRHIIRALGNIGGRQAEAKLLELLNSQEGIILGDIALALGKLRSQQAVGQLKAMSNHQVAWVRQNVAFALANITKY